MLNLNYTVEKEGIAITRTNQLMISESQINDLMNSFVANGYDVVEMSVLQFILGLNERKRKMDRYFLIDLTGDGLAIETAQVQFYASWLGLGIVVLSVVGYKIYKRIKKGNK